MSSVNENVTPSDPSQSPPPYADESWRTEHLKEPSKLFSGCLVAVTALLVGGSVLFLGSALQVQPARGATRSSRLQWQERQAEIEQALAEQRAYLVEGETNVGNSSQ